MVPHSADTKQRKRLIFACSSDTLLRKSTEHKENIQQRHKGLRNAGSELYNAIPGGVSKSEAAQNQPIQRVEKG